MAIVSGKCSSCNAVIKVNDEKDVGFCNSCGEKINVSEAIKNAISKENITPVAAQTPTETPSATQERKSSSRSAVQIINDLCTFCNTESDFLQLREKIQSFNVSSTDRAELLRELDRGIARHLVENGVFEKSEIYKELQKPTNFWLGVIGCSLIGTFFGPFGSGIGFWLGILGGIINLSKRSKKNINKYKPSYELLEQYKALGYKLEFEKESSYGLSEL